MSGAMKTRYSSEAKRKTHPSHTTTIPLTFRGIDYTSGPYPIMQSIDAARLEQTHQVESPCSRGGIQE